MKPAAFEYVRVSTLDEAVSILADTAGEKKVFAGGQSLLPLLNMRLARPEVLLDINGIAELDGLRGFVEVGGRECLEVGALVRQRRLERYCLEVLPSSRTELLVAALRHIGHPQTRNQGTVGGSLAHADASAELPLMLLTLGGSVVLRSARRERMVDAQDFFLSHYTTALEADELLTKSIWPLPGPYAGGAFKEFRRRRGDFALMAAACLVELDEQEAIQGIRLGIGGVAEKSLLIDEAREFVGYHWTRERGQAFAETVVGRLEFEDDVHASADYRRHLAEVLVSRIVGEACQDARARVGKARIEGGQPEGRGLVVARGDETGGGSGQERSSVVQKVVAGMRTPVTLRVNGRPYRSVVEPRMLLSDFLRQECGLTGTHVGCEHGVCGSCTVLIDGIAARSCLALAIASEGKEIITIEGLRGHPSFAELYRAFTGHHALQCGFCTAGIVASAMAELVGQNKGEEDITDVLSGHLCRCTGYLGIREAIEELCGPVAACKEEQ